jgi:hypothetical protein
VSPGIGATVHATSTASPMKQSSRALTEHSVADVERRFELRSDE